MGLMCKSRLYTKNVENGSAAFCYLLILSFFETGINKYLFQVLTNR